MSDNKFVDSILSFLLSIIVGIVLFFIFLYLTMTLFPPVAEDGIHTVMPLGQALSSITMSIIFGAMFLVFIYRKLRRRHK